MTQQTKQARARARKYSLDLSRYYRQPATQVSLSIVLSLVIVAFFLLVALRPTFVTIAKLKKEVEQSEKTLTQLTTKSKSLEQASRVWETIQPALPYIKSSIPESGPEYAKLSKSIEVFAKESGVNVTSVSIDESLIYSQILNVFEGKDREVVEMKLSVRVVGSFPQVLRFLESMLKVDRLIQLESVMISREVRGTDSTVVGLSMTGNVQYLANPKLLNKAINMEGK